MQYKFLEDVAIADVCFEAYGKSVEELFVNAGLALQETQVMLSGVRDKEKEEIELNASRLADLLFEFLEELVYLKDARQLVFSRFEIKVKEVQGVYYLNAFCFGEKISARHKLKADIKAVTLHMFELSHSSNGWKARVVLDI